MIDQAVARAYRQRRPAGDAERHGHVRDHQPGLPVRRDRVETARHVAASNLVVGPAGDRHAERRPLHVQVLHDVAARPLEVDPVAPVVEGAVADGHVVVAAGVVDAPDPGAPLEDRSPNPVSGEVDVQAVGADHEPVAPGKGPGAVEAAVEVPRERHVAGHGLAADHVLGPEGQLRTADPGLRVARTEAVVIGRVPREPGDRDAHRFRCVRRERDRLVRSCRAEGGPSVPYSTQ